MALASSENEVSTSLGRPFASWASLAIRFPFLVIETFAILGPSLCPELDERFRQLGQDHPLQGCHVRESIGQFVPHGVHEVKVDAVGPDDCLDALLYLEPATPALLAGRKPEIMAT